jgi:glutathione S-transferase
MALRVFGAGYSVYSRILRLALLEKGVAHDWVEVDIFGSNADREAQAMRHPFGKIPSLDHDGLTIYETGAAVRYLEQEAFGPVRLVPEDPAERARADQIAGIVDAYAYRGMVWDLFVECRKPAPDADVRARGVEMSAKVLDAVDALAGTGGALVGAGPSLADCYFAPVLAYFVRSPAGPEMLGRSQRIAAWWDVWRERPSMRETGYPQEDG